MPPKRAAKPRTRGIPPVDPAPPSKPVSVPESGDGTDATDSGAAANLPDVTLSPDGAAPIRESLKKPEPGPEDTREGSARRARAPTVVTAEGVDTQSILQASGGTGRAGGQRKPVDEGSSIDLEATSAESSTDSEDFHTEELPRLPSGSPSDASSDTPKKNNKRKAPVNEFCSGTFNGKWDMIDFAMAYHRFKNTDPAPHTVKPGNVTGYENEYEGRWKKKSRVVERDKIFWKRVKSDEREGSAAKFVDITNSARTGTVDRTGHKLAKERYKAARAGGIHLSRVPSLMYPYAAELAEEKIAKLVRSLRVKKRKGAPQSREERATPLGSGEEPASSDSDEETSASSEPEEEAPTPPELEEETEAPSEVRGESESPVVAQRETKVAQKEPKLRPKLTTTRANVRRSTRASRKPEKYGKWS